MAQSNRRDFIGILAGTAALGVVAGPEAFAEQNTKKSTKPAAPTQSAAPVVQVPPKPPQPDASALYQTGIQDAIANYEPSKPPLAAEAAVRPAAPQRNQGLAGSLHIGGSTPHDDPDQLMEGVILNLKTFSRAASALQAQTNFMKDGKPVGDPYKDGIEQGTRILFAEHVIDTLNKFKSQVPLEQFLRESSRNEQAEKVAPVSQPEIQYVSPVQYHLNLTIDQWKSPDFADQKLSQAIEQVDNLAAGFEAAIGKWKFGQKNGGIFGPITGAISNSNRAQNRFDTAQLAVNANHLRGVLEQDRAAFNAVLQNSGGTSGDPFAQPQTKPADPFAAPAPAQPVPPTPKKESILALPLPAGKEGQALAL